MRALAATIAVTTVALVACGADRTGQRPPGPEPEGVVALGVGVAHREPDVADEALRSLTRAQLEFALDLYRQAAVPGGDDLAIGPGSLHTALSMLLAGARGRTAREMAETMHVEDLPRLHELNNALERALRARNDDDGMRLDVANRVWSAPGLDLLDEYVETVAGDYGAALGEVDFGADPEAARSAVNQWVSSATQKKIEELFPRDAISQQTRLVLANALHVDARWRFPFPPEATRSAPFRLPDGTTVELPTMHYDERLPSGRGPGWQAVRLPYAGEKLTMTVIVPADLRAFERRLDADLLAQVDAAIKDRGIHLSLPRFTARTHLSLAQTLARMGMPAAFGSGADFSGMTSERGLSLAAVEHEAVVEVDEEGTEAAAGSGGAVAGSHGPTVAVDRPFLFLIRDEPTGAVLFLGRVTDPR